MADVIAYSRSQILANGTLAGSQLNWIATAGGSVDWTQCDALELTGSAQSVWLPVTGVSINRQGHPGFTINTPFVVITQCDLSPSRGTWILTGNPQDTGGASFQLTFSLNIVGSLPSTDLSNLNGAPFTSVPPAFSIQIFMGANVHVDFTPILPIGPGQRSAIRFATTSMVGPGNAFWAPFPPTGSGYTITFGYFTPGDPKSPQSYIDVTGFDPVKVAQYWTTAIAGPYLAGVRSAELVAPLSAVLTLEPPPAGNPLTWVYRALVVLTASGTSRTVKWNQGCFSAQGSGQFLGQDFRVHDGSAFALNATLDLVALPDLVSADWPSGVPVFVFLFSGLSTTQFQSVRLGALDLSFGPGSVYPDLPTTTYAMIGYNESGLPFWPGGPAMSVPRLSLNIEVKVTVQVGSEDALPAGTMPGTPDLPIVVQLASAPASPPPVPLLNLLQISEQNIDPTQGRTVDLNVFQPEGSTGFASLLILDRTPFLVARVNLPSLLGDGSASNGLVAEWSNTFDGGSWQCQSGAQPITLLLPPQGVGEAMERNRDIHGTGHIDYRFSPLAQIQIAPPLILDSDLGYYEAPWNLRRLLTTPGQDVPGALLPSFSAEFFYGLGVSVQSSQLRLAEISALTGRLAREVPQKANPTVAYTDHQAEWQSTLDTFQTRLSALVPWDGVQPGSLVLTSGTQYALRKAADLAYPATTGPAQGTTPYPVPAAGLKGGVGWIFENQGDYTSVWQKPQSTAALLADPIFSALGGWAKQRSEFLNGEVTINSHVEMGRVSTASLEILGRIGVFWNRAKHVVVYERTVQPSEQFEGDQDELLGRPIIRKVQEYIEILEPIRQYPEAGSSAIKTALVQGAEFKSKIIYIDSGWGSIVPNDPNSQQNPAQNGWRVPLWRQGADPFLYPQPHIVLHVALDPNTGSGSQTQEIAQPEKVFFYQTTNAGPDTNTWASVPTVDYDDLNTNYLANQKYRLAVHPGFGPFTWNLAPGAFAANLVAARSVASPISAGLKNVTMMRAAPTPGTSASVPPLQALKGIPDRVTSLFQELGDTWQTSVSDTIGSSDLSTYFQGLGQAVSGAFSSVTPQIRNVIDSAKASFTKLTEDADDYLNEVIENVQLAISSSPPPVFADLARTQSALLDSAIASLKIDPKILANAQQQVTSLVNAVAPLLGSPADWSLNNLLNVQQAVLQGSRALASQMSLFQGLSGTQLSPGWANLATIESRLANPIGALLTGAPPQVGPAITALMRDINAIQGVVQSLGANPPVLTLDPAAAPLSAVTNLRQAQKWLVDAGSTPVQNAIEASQTSLSNWLNTQAAAWAPAQTAIQDALNTAGTSLLNVMLAREKLSGDLSAGLSDLQAQVQSTIGGFLAAGNLFAGAASTQFLSTANQELSLVRAFGAPPIADGLDFALTQVRNAIPGAPVLQNLAYFFDSTLPQVPITWGVQSILTQAAQTVSDHLLPMNLSVPVNALLDRIVPDPDAIKDFLFTGLTGIFQNLAGMDLGFLFSGLLPPLNTPDCIQIKHSINPQTLKVQVEADINVPFTNDIEVFSEGPIYLRLLNARFQATVSLQAGAGQQTVETVNGSIGGDWEVQIAGLSLVTFVSTSLTFDQSGHIQFNVSPERIRLASVMQFIADLVNEFIPSGSGLTITFDTAPVAVVCNLDLPMPDIAGGVFAISNIRLGALFSLGLDENENFQFTVGMNLCTMEAPFALVVFILGGGGWIEARLTYTPGSGRVPVVQVEIGISAIAALEIALGPVSGGVMISFSLFAQYDSGAQSTLDIGICIVIAGHVSLLSIVEADITLMLEADYSAGRLTGRGSISVDIKICWCFTLSIHEEVEYSFGNASGGSNRSFLAASAGALGPVSDAATFSDQFWNAANAYIEMLSA